MSTRRQMAVGPFAPVGVDDQEEEGASGGDRTRDGDRDLERRWHDTRRRSNGGAVVLRGHGV